MTEILPLELRKFVAPEIVFGRGARSLVPQYVRNLGARRVLLVTDPGVREAGWSTAVFEDLLAAGIPTEAFDEVTPNPKDHEVHRGVEAYRDADCAAIVAVGGGSPMDCAKGIAIVSSNGGYIADYEGVDRVSRPCPPLVFVPTTAGTSADVSQFAIITDVERQSKMAIVSKAVVPDVALVDPITTTTMDRELTAHTGMDAFTHAAEALASNASSPLTDLHAIEGARLVSKHLRAVLDDLAGDEHRTGMMLGSLQAGLAFSNASLGAVHAMAHALGGRQDLPHGCCNALLLPYVMDFNYEEAREPYLRLGRAMGLDLDETDAAGTRAAVLGAVRDLQRDAGADTTLGALGVVESDLRALAEMALRDACIVTNPRRPTVEEIEDVLLRAL